MCYNGYSEGDTESEREAAQPYETDGDLPFLPDPNEWVEPIEGEDPLYDLLKRDAEDEPEA